MEGVVRVGTGWEKASFAVHAKDVEAMDKPSFEAFCLRNLPDCVETRRYEVAV